ncbi:MAG: hypothetical protein RLY31_953 [Bacteroidota bacterium]
MKRLTFFSICCTLLVFIACRPEGEAPPYHIEQSKICKEAMVVAEHPLASAVGVEILRAGGNAVDAAIATQFALAVVHPRAGNIGGGGFLVVRLSDGEIAALDYRETAPAAAHRDMYLDSSGAVMEKVSREGHSAVGVPGTVAGMEAAFRRFSRLQDWHALLAPALRLAEEGFRITASEAERLNEYRPKFLEYNADASPFVREEDWRMGDLLVQPDLARTLRRIQQHGAAGFYEGETADLLVREMARGGGLITKDDLLRYEAVWREPVTGRYKDYRIISMPPSSSGGVALLQLLGMLETVPLRASGFQSTAAVHAMVEAERRVYADRATLMGDSDFYPVPLNTLLDPDYVSARFRDFSPTKATPSTDVGGGMTTAMPESFETTHTSIVDAFGNAASVTTTLNLNYGAKVIVEGAGFFLNDEMDDFSAKPGVPNFFGLVGAEANAIQPGKRMLSSMTPTIVEKDSAVFMVLGAPGGSTIITAVLQTFLNVVDYDMPVDRAIAAPRFHHQWLPDEISCEPDAIDSLVRQELTDMGHSIRSVDRMALVKAILRLPDHTWHGAGDPRNPDDHVAGY